MNRFAFYRDFYRITGQYLRFSRGISDLSDTWNWRKEPSRANRIGRVVYAVFGRLVSLACLAAAPISGEWALLLGAVLFWLLAAIGSCTMLVLYEIRYRIHCRGTLYTELIWAAFSDELLPRLDPLVEMLPGVAQMMPQEKSPLGLWARYAAIGSRSFSLLFCRNRVELQLGSKKLVFAETYPDLKVLLADIAAHVRANA